MAGSLAQLNPYQPPPVLDRDLYDYTSDVAPLAVTLVDRSFLLRRIYIPAPLDAALCWNGRGLKEFVRFDGRVVAHSYAVTYTPHFQFEVVKGPARHWLSVDVEILFLFVVRFQVYLDGKLIYSEQR